MTDHRLAALFLVALALIAGQAWRTKPVLQPDFEVATRAGERVLPLGVPMWRPLAAPPVEIAARREFLRERSVSWPSATAGSCELFVRISAQHWARRFVALEPSSVWFSLRWSAAGFLDDDDGDGDALDPDELTAGAQGVEVEGFCP